MRLKTKFQDTDLRLGEVVDASIMYGSGDKIRVSCPEKMKDHTYNSIKDFTDHWEDYKEEPKKGWYLDSLGNPTKIVFGGDGFRQSLEAIGNYFETKEEAEKAVEKLKTWKRLEDKGFKFERVKEGVMGHEVKIYARFTNLREDEIDTAFFDNQKDLELLFGGEE